VIPEISRAEPLPNAFGIPNCVTPTPHAFRIAVQETPVSLRIPVCCPWYGMDIFWNHPILNNRKFNQPLQ